MARFHPNSVVIGPRNRPKVKKTTGPLATVNPSIAPSTTHQGLRVVPSFTVPTSRFSVRVQVRLGEASRTRQHLRTPGTPTSRQIEKSFDVGGEDVALLLFRARRLAHRGNRLANRRPATGGIERRVAAEEQPIGAEKIAGDVEPLQQRTPQGRRRTAGSIRSQGESNALPSRAASARRTSRTSNAYGRERTESSRLCGATVSSGRGSPA